MTNNQPTIIYTLTDEAPMLATWAFLPIIRSFTAPAGIAIESSDISVAARVLGEFGDYLTDAQKVPDNLAQLARYRRIVAALQPGEPVRAADELLAAMAGWTGPGATADGHPVAILANVQDGSAARAARSARRRSSSLAGAGESRLTTGTA